MADAGSTQDPLVGFAARLEETLAQLRRELEERLRQVREDLERQLAAAALRPETLAPVPIAAPAAESLQPARPTPEELLDAAAALDAAPSQAAMLRALLAQGRRFAARTAVFLTPTDAPRLWAGDGGSASAGVSSSWSDEGWRDLAPGRGTVWLDEAAATAVGAPLGGPAPAAAVLIPLVLQDRVAAALYADRLADTATFEPAVLQLLAHLASLGLEALPWRERAATPSLWWADAGEVALPLWDAAWAGGAAAAAGAPAAVEAAPAALASPLGGWDLAEPGAPPAAASAEEAPATIEADQPPVVDAETLAGGLPEPTALGWGFEAAPPADLEVTLAILPEPPGGDWAREPAPPAAPPAPEPAPPEAAPATPWTAWEDLTAEPAPAAGLAEPPPAASVYEPEALGWQVESVEPAAPISVDPWAEDAVFVPRSHLEAPPPPAPAEAAEPPLLLEPEPLAPPAVPSFAAGWEWAAAIPEEGSAGRGEPAAEAAPEPAAEAAPEPAAEAAAWPTPPPTPEAGAETPAEAVEPPPAPAAPFAPPPPAALPGAGAFLASPLRESVEVRPPADLRGPGSAFAPSQAAARGEEAAHEEARRLARLLVSELMLYNEPAVLRGRRERAIYALMRDEIERSRQVYEERVEERVRSDYFDRELVRVLAAGDAGALGR